MHWLWKDIAHTAREYWLIAQGVPSYLWERWKKPLFWSTPERCQMCGRKWRPDMPHYKTIDGTIIKTEFGYRWFNQEYGLIRPTGHLEDHDRGVCRDCIKYHGVYICSFGRKIRSVITREPSVARSALWFYRDAKYWTRTILKFFKLYAQTWVNFAQQPRHYIRCRKAQYDDVT
jgi:hypothetical protein